MIDFLLGVPGKLKTLTDRLTSGRATNLDNLDAAVTSRAAASTALSNVTWTNALAALLGNTIQTSILSGAVQTGYFNVVTPTTGAGEDTYYTDITITAIADTTKCIVMTNGYSGGNTTVNYFFARLTSTTNLRIASVSAGSMAGRWYVIPLK